ncbi:hypothetical protein ILUMI_22068 [Ignelater luminosus]|uniref:Bifunctional lysine-specific demethylase and histidyl-hydroxylase n=1 Tax=Ignelater luminosus TaxID=2038154 RepID=A0A8K0FXK0_IGNLU|nr:hypothetical protein ILUMI_22068 [Ignelater luminosus]
MASTSAFSMYKNQLKSNAKIAHKKKKRLSKKINNKNLEHIALNLISGGKVNGTENGIKKKQNSVKKQKLLQKHKSKIAKPTSSKLLAFTASTVSKDSKTQSSKKAKSLRTEKVLQQNFVSSPSFYEQPSQVFEWIIAPVKPTDFFKTFWEKSPFYIKRNKENYYNQILTTEKLDTILREHSLFYTRNVDVVSYENGQRETHNPEGRAVPSALWDYYANGCSIRILNPHTYCNKLHTLLTALHEYFGCMAGVNVYLTPPGSQGFAPHYDDIEAFVLQLEGRKHWKLYAPLTDSEVLPRFSSKNLDRNELKPPIKEVTLEAGDLLYFPRGIIHEGFTDKDAHSLHITVSVYQRTAYVDLLEHILKPALVAASQDDVEFREGLPLQYLKHIGLSNRNSTSNTRNEIQRKIENLFGKMLKYISVDAAADQMGKQFMWDAMPPIPLKEEKVCMVHGDGDKMLNGKVCNKGEIHLDLKVRLLRYHCLRLVKEEEETENSIRIYYCTENAKYYHGEEQQFLVIDKTLASAVKYLINQYPKFVEVKSIPLEDDTEKMQIVSDLWEKGLLVTEKPLASSSD